MGSQRVIIFVPTVGLEPTRAQCPKDFLTTLCYHNQDAAILFQLLLSKTMRRFYFNEVAVLASSHLVVVWDIL